METLHHDSEIQADGRPVPVLASSPDKLDEKKNPWMHGVEEVDAEILDAKDYGDPGTSDKPIVTGADVAANLLSLRDDHDPSLTIRSCLVGTVLAAAQATMDQIATFRPAGMGLSRTLMLIVTWVVGRAWAKFLPRGDLLEAKWREEHSGEKLPLRIRIWKVINPTSFGLKEHAVGILMAASASNATASINVFTVQILFFEQHLSALTVILSTLSIGLFGYGLTGVLQPFTVWPSESVYWANISTVHVLQAFHWDDWAGSKRMRYFWYCVAGMAAYEIIPAYIFPYLNSVSIPCLAAMHVKNPTTAARITNLFGGSIANEGLGFLALSFDWGNIGQTTLPLKWQANSGLGVLVGYIAISAVYYGNAWNALKYPFLSMSLFKIDGSRYSVAKVFVNGVVDRAKLATYGLPRMTGSYAWEQLTNNMAIGGMFAHVILFWGKDLVQSFKNIRSGESEDPHHRHMQKHYAPAPWWWFASIMLFSFVLGLVAVLKGDVSLPVWAYIVALLFGSIVAPFTNLLYSRFNSGCDTNNLCKMLAGAVIPGHAVGNLYFASWSHNVIGQANSLASDLKLGEYLKIPPQVMVATQIWGTVFGAFIHYVVMITIVETHRDILLDLNGNYIWTGNYFQGLQNKAATWALAKDLYAVGKPYGVIPAGLGIGAAMVAVYFVFSKFVPKIGKWSTNDLNLPTAFIYSGQLVGGGTSTYLSSYTVGFFSQFYLRNWHPRIFKEYLWILSGALDTGVNLVTFILNFAVYGAAGTPHPFPTWWGSLTETGEYLDHCPDPRKLAA